MGTIASPSTFIKLDRNILNWRWFKDANTFRVFLYLLLKANISDCGFENIVVRRGEIATSYGSIAEKLNLSVRNVRTAIEHLKSTGEVTVKIYPKYQVIAILCYDKYQSTPTGKVTGNRQASDRQPTGNRQASDRQPTGNRQQYKNIRSKEDKEDIRRKEAACTGPLDADGMPPTGTPEWERWRNQ